MAQKPAKPSGAELHQAIKKLNVLGSVLYVAAHPDDENQRFISYCANEKHFNVTYLSLTRGDGGQNLIGPELRELLGVLRTEELLMARSIDGGKQMFSRANDFGFSKSPDETLRIWEKDKVLADVVWAIRKTRPDVIVNRFYHDKKYDTHGHHTASGMLSVEAFDLAGKKEVYPEQLQYVEPWQPRRTFFNTSWFFFGGREKFEKMDKSNLFALDVGVYYPLKGKSNNEVSAEARSMHRCQGFGAMSARGESMDWFDFIKGDRPSGKDLFEGINTSWSRVEGGGKIGKLMADIDANFRADRPAASVPDLLKAQKMIAALPDSYWKRTKLTEIKEVIRGCLGLYLEAVATEPGSTPGEMTELKLEAILRGSVPNVPVVLTQYAIAPSLLDTVVNFTMPLNAGAYFSHDVKIPANASFTAPYWLLEEYNTGMYKVDNQQLRGVPETPRLLKVFWKFNIGGQSFEYETDVAYKVEESAIGEVWRPFEVLPPAFVEFTETAYVIPGAEKEITVKVKAGRNDVAGTLSLRAPKGWLSDAELNRPFKLSRKGEEQEFRFVLRPSQGADVTETNLTAQVQVDGRDYNMQLVTIKYDHIPQQSVLKPATVKASRIDLKVKSKNIGYYMGAGDEVPAALRQMGCTVNLLEDKDIETDKLARFDAIVIGVRAYNTKENLKFHHAKLMEYVQNGGTLVLQYNNNFELFLDQLAPAKMKLSRTRVTDEAAEVRFLLPDHALLNQPNKLSANDFNGWVQERGLYFPGEWEAPLEAPVSCNDPGEKPADGAILTMKHGKGHYIYTGISFFRELPAGVPGAYRLFANMISLGKM